MCIQACGDLLGVLLPCSVWWVVLWWLTSIVLWWLTWRSITLSCVMSVWQGYAGLLGGILPVVCGVYVTDLWWLTGYGITLYCGVSMWQASGEGVHQSAGDGAAERWRPAPPPVPPGPCRLWPRSLSQSVSVLAPTGTGGGGGGCWVHWL